MGSVEQWSWASSHIEEEEEELRTSGGAVGPNLPQNAASQIQQGADVHPVKSCLSVQITLLNVCSNVNWVLKALKHKTLLIAPTCQCDEKVFMLELVLLGMVYPEGYCLDLCTFQRREGAGSERSSPYIGHCRGPELWPWAAVSGPIHKVALWDTVWRSTSLVKPGWNLQPTYQIWPIA